MIELLQTLAKNPPSHNLGFALAILALAFLLALVRIPLVLVSGVTGLFFT